jgi:transposase-like protein
MKGRHYPNSIITTCVRWYLTSVDLSTRKIALKCAQRGLKLHHCTIRLWVQEIGPELLRAPQPAPPHNYVIIRQKRKMRKQMRYLHRLAAQDHTTIDFFVGDEDNSIQAIEFFAGEHPAFAELPEMQLKWLINQR